MPSGHVQTEIEDWASTRGVEVAEMKWYAAFTNSHHEKRVAEQLAQRHIEFFLPLYRTTHRWKNRCNVELQLPLFPSYLFVHLDLTRPLRLYDIRGLAALVGGKQPSPLPDFEINSLRTGMHLRKIEPHPFLTVGEKVRIKAGAFADWQGILVRKKNAFRVVISLNAIMKSISVEVDCDDLEPIPSHSEC